VGPPGPDQDVALRIDGELLGYNEFVLECRDSLVQQIELQFQAR
jgi:hypothetical protein